MNLSKILIPQPIITQVILQGSQIGISNDRAVEGLQNFAEVRVLVAVGDAIVQWLTYDTHQPTQTITAYYSERYTSSVEFKCDLSTGTIGVMVRSTTGWYANQSSIRMVVGVISKYPNI